MNFNETTQIGNFLVTKQAANGNNYLKVQTVSNTWTITWHESTDIYHIIDSELNASEDINQAIHVFIINLYLFSTTMDAQLIQDQINIIANHFQRIIDNIHNQNKEEQDQEERESQTIIQQEKIFHELKQYVQDTPLSFP